MTKVECIEVLTVNLHKAWDEVRNVGGNDKMEARYFIGYRVGLGSWSGGANPRHLYLNDPETFDMGVADGKGDLESLLDRTPNR